MNLFQAQKQTRSLGIRRLTKIFSIILKPGGLQGLAARGGSVALIVGPPERDELENARRGYMSAAAG